MDENRLRQLICDYMSTNPSLMDDLSLKDMLSWEGVQPDHYISDMRRSSTWGGAIEIKAFCEIFKFVVEVKVRSTQKSIMFYPSAPPPTSLPTLVRIEWQGCHFEPIPFS
jgi:hypothetical protein